jgi:dipeptidyl aminopeptidase/acylaminoacyl peptidase
MAFSNLYFFTMKHFILAALLAMALPVFAQTKKALDHADVHRWRKIEQQKLSNNGQYAVWTQTPVSEGDSEVHVWSAATGTSQVFSRSSEPQFSDDSKWLVFRIKPALDTLKALRRKKVKEEDLPKDTLAIFDLKNQKLEKIARLKSFVVPEKWSGWMAFQVETEKVEKPAPAPKDTSKVTVPDSTKMAATPKPPKEAKNGKKPKKEDKENGYRLLVRNFQTGKQDTFAYVKDFVFAKKGPRLMFTSTGKGDTLTFSANKNTLHNGVYLLDLQPFSLRVLHRGKGKFQQLAMDDYGRQASFLADTDTSKARIRPWKLAYWEAKQDSAKYIATDQSAFLPKSERIPGTWGISEHARLTFSEDASKLYFGIAPPPILNDTLMLKEEIVDVEVWSWNDKRLYTQEEIRLENEKKRSYPMIYHIKKNSFVQVGAPEVPELRFQEKRDLNIALGYTEEPYLDQITSVGTPNKDLYAVNLETGERKAVVKNLRCNPRLSPSGKFISWWSDQDTAWFAWNAATATIAQLTNNRTVPFYNEENDVPDLPGEHGMAGWLDNDEAMLVYDKYDIWRVDPTGKAQPVCLTDGRNSKTTYRYIRLDPEEYSINPQKSMLLHKVNDVSKSEGYIWLSLSNRPPMFVPFLKKEWAEGYAYTRNMVKARYEEVFMYTRENYTTFPNLIYTSATAGEKQISNANPQQSEYYWGSIEMVEWTSLTGEKLKGMLVKPDGFDPKKQYPMIVNFYEKMSGDLLRHRSPDFPRSQINFTFYASRGYLVFAPDIPYQIGYPGESAYNAIMSGVTAMIGKGFVDPKRLALQGHSWGGYQAAYLVTRTNLFTCAEAGAPVANMTSAYGGIRWESGLVRMFQYEHQQSRIGGTLWEKPKQFLENSPLFSLDKVETPLLILHNDKDGAVPWYQGIELFTGLRRLGKPAWLLNYNDEPHWPVKLQNRVDFQRRMQQFFDHYLQGAPEPSWMKRGVPPMEKGILQGF